MKIQEISRNDIGEYCKTLLETTEVGHIFTGENEDILKQLFNKHSHIKYLHNGTYKVGINALENGFKTFEIISDLYTTPLRYKDALKGLRVPPIEKIKSSLKNALNQPDAMYVNEIIEDYINTIKDVEHFASYCHKSYFNKYRLSNEVELLTWIKYFKNKKLEYVRKNS